MMARAARACLAVMVLASMYPLPAGAQATSGSTLGEPRTVLAGFPGPVGSRGKLGGAVAVRGLPIPSTSPATRLRNAVSETRRMRDRPGSVGRGAFWGAAVGGVTGGVGAVLILYAADDAIGSPVVAAALGTVIGAAVGAGVGVLWHYLRS